MQFQGPASIDPMHGVLSDSDQRHIKTEGCTPHHLDASPLLTRAYNRFQSSPDVGIRWTFAVCASEFRPSPIKPSHLPVRGSITSSAYEKIYRAIILSTLLYVADTRTAFMSHVTKIHAFMMRHLWSIVNIKWHDKVTNIKVLKRAGLPSMEDLYIRKNIRWTGHLLRMSNDRNSTRKYHEDKANLYSHISVTRHNQEKIKLLPTAMMMYFIYTTVFIMSNKLVS